MSLGASLQPQFAKGVHKTPNLTTPSLPVALANPLRRTRKQACLVSSVHLCGCGFVGMCASLVPGPFHIDCVGEGKGPGTHCFADVTLRYDFPQNVCEALYVPHLLVGGPPKALLCLVQPRGVEGRPSWMP